MYFNDLNHLSFKMSFINHSDKTLDKSKTIITFICSKKKG